MNQQEQELLDRRSAELGAANKRIFAMAEEHRSLLAALSIAVHDARNAFACADALEAEIALARSMLAEMKALAAKRRHSVVAELITRYRDLFEGIEPAKRASIDADLDLDSIKVGDVIRLDLHEDDPGAAAVEAAVIDIRPGNAIEEGWRVLFEQNGLRLREWISGDRIIGLVRKAAREEVPC